MKTVLITSLLLLLVNADAHANSLVADTMIENLMKQGNYSADSSRGKKLWQMDSPSKAKPFKRSCSSCHTENLTHTGKHVKTGRTIVALAPSVNNKSLTKVKKINKWLKRNCLWTLGRECNMQEKIDLLTFIKQQ